TAGVRISKVSDRRINKAARLQRADCIVSVAIGKTSAPCPAKGTPIFYVETCRPRGRVVGLPFAPPTPQRLPPRVPDGEAVAWPWVIRGPRRQGRPESHGCSAERDLRGRLPRVFGVASLGAISPRSSRGQPLGPPLSRPNGSVSSATIAPDLYSKGRADSGRSASLHRKIRSSRRRWLRS